MAEQDPNNRSNTIPIIGSEFVRAQPSDLTIVGDTVKDSAGNKVFKVKTPLFGLHNKRILLDPNDSPIVTMKMKVYLVSFTLVYIFFLVIGSFFC